MKRFLTILATIGLALGLSACSYVESGYVAVKVNAYGDDRGVQQEVLGPGRYMSGPNTTFHKFPTFTITDKWQRKAEIDQSITFQAAGGISVNGDYAIAFHIEPANVPKVFQRYRRGVDEISDNFLRNMVRDELNRLAVSYEVETLQAEGKQKLLDDVTANVQKAAAAVGITVEDISYISELRFPANVVAAINAKIEATQQAMKVENEVRRTKAEAEKAVVAAEAQVRVAQAEAQAIAARGAALRANGEALKLRELENQAAAIEKWNGALPGVTGAGALPFLKVN
jgi:regulator of protease activity HflC (stomatin/prohibitin superfamily)